MMIRRVCMLLMFVVALVSLASRANGREILVNGSFEDDEMATAGQPAMTGWHDGPGFGNDVGFAHWEHVFECSEDGFCVPDMGVPAGELPGPLGQAAVKPNGVGRFFGGSWGRANGLGNLGSAMQILSVSEHRDKPFTFSSWLASRPSAPPTSDTDYAILSLQFFTGANGSGEALGSVMFDGNDVTSAFIVGSLNADGIADPTVPATQDNWTFYRATGRIPDGAQSASVIIRGATIDSEGRDGYVDLVSLQVVPEPHPCAASTLRVIAARRCDYIIRYRAAT